jgi:hypothetical protein
MYVIMKQAGGGADYGNQKKFMCIATFLPLKQQQIERGNRVCFSLYHLHQSGLVHNKSELCDRLNTGRVSNL